MSMRLSVRAALLCALLAVIVGMTVGLVLGYLLSTRTDPEVTVQRLMVQRLTRDAWSEDPHVTQRILEDIDPQQIRDNLKFLSREPHLAGSNRDDQLAVDIRDIWLRNGLDTVDLVPYQVLLSYSNRKKGNTVQLLGNDGEVVFASSHREIPLRPEDDHEEFVHAFHAYSPSGVVEGNLIFVNYGSEDDWTTLEQQMNVTGEGKIALLKEGGVPTGTKIKLAQERGAIAVLTYPDPSDVASGGTTPDVVYPFSGALPGTGIVRSSAATGLGDPLTPGYPALPGVRRLQTKQARLPQIPSQPISYDDAFQFLAWLAGEEAPEHWIGHLNLTYRVGPGFSQKNMKVRLRVNNKYRMVTVQNVIATIKGDVEPDRYVLLGNHRDAWGFGAVDPSSGTAMMLELTRVLGQLHREGWKPRRTLVFCSWAAEEFALIGSTEWVEENLPQLQERAVAYINTDICVIGSKFTTMASPILKDAIYHVTKMIPDPEGEAASLYDAWRGRKNSDDGDQPEPFVDRLGPYSDFAPFIFFAGVPVMDMSWQSLENQTGSVYPTYHTGYETYYLMEKFIDPTFIRHRGCGHVAGLMLRYLADSSFLPLSVEQVARSLHEELNTFKLMDVHTQLVEQGLPFDKLEEAVRNFTIAAESWQETLLTTDRQNPIKVRMLNDQLMAVERAFTALPKSDNNWFSRHRLYSSGPSIMDLLNTLDSVAEYSVEAQSMWMDVERHLSELIVAIHHATKALQM